MVDVVEDVTNLEREFGIFKVRLMKSQGMEVTAAGVRLWTLEWHHLCQLAVFINNAFGRWRRVDTTIAEQEVTHAG